MNKAEIKDNHLHITYEYYDYGHQIGRKIIPLEDIECLKATYGPRGGLHSWSINGYDPQYSDSGYFEDEKRDIAIFSGGRKTADLIEQIQKLLPNLKCHEKVESGGAI